MAVKQINISGFLVFCAMVACCFPFSRLIPVDTYTQPTGLLLCALFIIVKLKSLSHIYKSNKTEISTLLYFAALGVAMFLIGAFESLGARSLIWMLAYVSPLIFFVFFAIALRQHKRLVTKIIVVSFIIWLVVALVQTFIDDNFMKFLAGSARAEASLTHRDSGRGVLSLAPEPTHFGLQMLLYLGLLSAIQLNRFSLRVVGLSALLFSLSTTAVATLVGSLALLLYRYIILVVVLSVLVWVFLSPLILESDLRIFSLMTVFLEDPSLLIQLDYSVNMRVGGIYAAVHETFDSFLLPAGLSHLDWLQGISDIYKKYTWLVEVSEEGWPSGYGIVFYQAGFLSLPLFFFLGRIVFLFRAKLDVYIVSGLLVFVSQFSLNSPFFGFILAALVFSGRAAGQVNLARGLGYEADIKSS